MTRIFKHRNRFTWVMLMAYLAFLSFSGFHYHRIDIRSCEDIQCRHEEPSPVNNDPVNSVFSCQLNIIFNSSFTNQVNVEAFKILPFVSSLPAISCIHIPAKQILSSNQLRAPPVSC